MYKLFEGLHHNILHRHHLLHSSILPQYSSLDMTNYKLHRSSHHTYYFFIHSHFHSHPVFTDIDLARSKATLFAVMQSLKNHDLGKVSDYHMIRDNFLSNSSFYSRPYK